MNSRKLLARGLILFAMGGCAAQPKQVAFTPQTAPKTNTGIFDLQSQSDGYGNNASASDTAAQMLAIKAKDFVQNGSDTPNTAIIPPLDSNRSGYREGRRPAINSPGYAASAGDPEWNSPNARQAGAKLSPQQPMFNGGPRIVAEGDDFASTRSGSDGLAQRLLKRARDNPRDLSNQLDLMLYGMLNDDQSPDLGALSTIEPEDRELLSTLVDGLTNFRSTVREDVNMLPAARMRPLQDMVERLHSQADLTVPVAVLCRKVDGYGKYDPITPTRFPANHDNRVIVYCEIENFLAKQNTQQMWEARLSEQVSLYTDSGLLVWNDDKQSVTDECRNRRRDFYCFNKITLPASLTVGRYVLKVSIEDQNSEPSRIAEASVQLSVTAR